MTEITPISTSENYLLQLFQSVPSLEKKDLISAGGSEAIIALCLRKGFIAEIGFNLFDITMLGKETAAFMTTYTGAPAPEPLNPTLEDSYLDTQTESHASWFWTPDRTALRDLMVSIIEHSEDPAAVRELAGKYLTTQIYMQSQPSVQ